MYYRKLTIIKKVLLTLKFYIFMGINSTELIKKQSCFLHLCIRDYVCENIS